MNEYTPTTGEVAARFQQSSRNEFGHRDPRHKTDLEFDRWLVAHDAEVAAKAWAEGAQWAAVECGVIREKANGWVTDADNPHIVP